MKNHVVVKFVFVVIKFSSNSEILHEIFLKKFTNKFVDWSSNQTSNSNTSIWFDLQIENFDLNLNLNQAQTFDTLKDLSLNQISNQNVKIWFEFESSFKFRCRIWFDSSKILISWRITLFRDIFDTSYKCFFSKFSNFFFALFHIDQTW